MLPSCHLSTSLTSKRAQLKSAPTPPQSLTILLPNRSRATAWCKFCRPDLPKVLPSCHFSTSLTSKRPSRHSLVQILRPATSKSRPTMPVFGDFGSKLLFWFSAATSWAADPSRPPVFGSCLCKPTAATQLWTNVAFRAIPTRQNDRVSHVCAVSFLRDRVFC